MKKLSILLAGVCLTAALYSVGTTYGQNKTNFAKQKEDTVTTNKYQGVTIKDKAKGKVTKQQVREHLKWKILIRHDQFMLNLCHRFILFLSSRISFYFVTTVFFRLHPE